jgi:predicted site-specific integrase-resolvase
MNLYDLLLDNSGINITLTAGQLIEVIEYSVQKTRADLEQQITDANTETYPSSDAVAKMLGITKTTLWRWAQSNYLVPIEIGGKRRYRSSDVRKILEGK